MNREEEIEKVKKLIKKHFEKGNCGLYNSRNTTEDEITNVFCGKYIDLDISYPHPHSHFEVFGLTDREFLLLKEYYNNLERAKNLEETLKLNRYISQLRFERDLLQDIVDEKDIPEETRVLLSKIHEDTALVERINKAIDKLICWGDLLDADFQKEMLEILGYDEDKYIDWLKQDKEVK